MKDTSHNFTCALLGLLWLALPLGAQAAALFTARPNPVAPGKTVTFSADLNPNVTASGAKVTLWLYDGANNFVGSASATGVNFTAGKATAATLTFATASNMASGTYTYNLSYYSSTGIALAGAAGVTDAGNFAVGVTVSGPHLTSEPANLTVIAGQSASFTVVATGSGLSYQWKLNGNDISGATEASYSIASSASSNAGTYTVTVSNAGGSVTSTGAVLAVNPIVAGTGKIKWHPGHYGGSGGIAFAGASIDPFLPEMNEMLKDDWIVGYKLFVAWGALDNGPVTFTASVGGATSGTLTKAPRNGSQMYWMRFADGEYRSVSVSGTAASWSGALRGSTITSADAYMTTLFDQILTRLRTAYNKPKYFVIALMPMNFGGGTRSPGDGSLCPDYIGTDRSMGPSPIAGTYGWWGTNNPSGGTYTCAVYRPAVAARYALLGQALGAKYNSDPYFEAIMDQEDSAVVGNARAGSTFGGSNSNDGTYSDAGYVSAMESFLTAWREAFPNTSIVSENTWLNDDSLTEQFEGWMIRGGSYVAPGTADISGQSYYTSHPGLNSWGLAAYAGVTITGSTWTGPDSRGYARAMVDVEGGDIGSGSGGRIDNTPLDICNGLNQSVKASHAFWSHYMSGDSNAPTWAQAAAVLRDNPLKNTGYPANYPK